MTIKEFLKEFEFEEYYTEEDEYNKNKIFRSFRKRFAKKSKIELMVVDNNGDWEIEWAEWDYEIEDCHYAVVEVYDKMLEMIEQL